MSSEPLIVRYRGLWLALIALFAMLLILATVQWLVAGQWAPAMLTAITLIPSYCVFVVVRDYEP